MTSDTNAINAEIDQALAAERAEVNERTQQTLARQARISKLGGWLRFIGALGLLASVATFMCQHWDGMEHLARYLSFVGFTALVCAAGLLCGLKIGESKGARTLLGAVVAFIPVHCAQMGAILFSQMSYSDWANSCPRYLYWHVASMSDALIALVVGLITLAPMAYMSFSVLARRHAKELFITGFAVSSLLLIPTRDPLVVGVLLAAATAYTLYRETSHSGVIELKTFEAFVARAVPILAIFTIVGRQAAIYDSRGAFLGFMFALVSVILFETSPQITKNRALIGMTEVASIITTAISVLCVSHSILVGFSAFYTPVRPLIIGLPLVIAYTFMAERARVCGAVLRASAAVALIGTGSIAVLDYHSLSTSLSILVLGIAAITAACITEQRALLFAGIGVTILAFLRAAALAYESLYLSSWVALGLVGIATIVVASLLERHYATLGQRIVRARKTIGAWK